MNIDKSQLKALAESATFGQWVPDGEYVNEHGNVLYAYVAHESGGRVAEAFANCLVRTDEQCRANAAFIAAANPATVLALLAEIERLSQSPFQQVVGGIAAAVARHLAQEAKGCLEKGLAEQIEQIEAESEKMRRFLAEVSRTSGDKWAVMAARNLLKEFGHD